MHLNFKAIYQLIVTMNIEFTTHFQNSLGQKMQ